MAVRVHAHEAGELHETRVDAPPRAAMPDRHGRQDRALEPLERARLRELVRLGRAHARVDRAAHQGHARRRGGMVAGAHDRGRGERRDRGLAHRDQVRVRPERLEEPDDVVDIVVEVEAARLERHLAGVDPVGDRDVVAGQQRRHGVAQQRGVVAGHRRDHEHARLVRRGARAELAEAAELGEGPRGDDLLAHLDALARDLDMADAELRLAVGARGALEDLASRGDRASHARVGGRDQRVAEDMVDRLGHEAGRGDHGAVQVVEVVEQVDLSPVVARREGDSRLAGKSSRGELDDA